MTTSGSEDSYHFVGIGQTSIPVTQYVVDTNVVSHVEALIRSGVPTDKTPKAEALCRILASNPAIGVIDDFAWIEGSSFHRASGLSPTSIVLRDLAAEVLLNRPGDLVTAVSEIEGWLLPEEYESDVRDNLDRALSAMMLTVVPCYIAALIIEGRHQEDPIDRLTVADVDAVIEVLSSELNYVPGVLLVILKLACVGTEASRKAAMGVLKTGRRSRKRKQYLPVQNALSAAWDLGVLQLLSAKLSQGINSMLVTEDGSLAALASLITVSQGFVGVKDSAVEATMVASVNVRRIDAVYALRRAAARPEMPDRARAARVIRDAEGALPGESSFPSVLERGIEVDFPVLVFGHDALNRVVDVVGPTSADSIEESLMVLLDGDLNQLQERFDAAFVLSTTFLELVGARQQLKLSDVLRPLADRDEYGHEVAITLSAFAGAQEEPFRAIVYRELFCRPKTVGLKLTSIVAGLFVLVEHWAPRLGTSRSALVSETIHRMEEQLIDPDSVSGA